MPRSDTSTFAGSGEWQPDELIPVSPLFSWPPRLGAIAKYFFSYPGYFLPWNLGYMLLAVLTWLFLTPELSRMKTFQFDWIALIYMRNLGLLFLIAGAWHFRFYIQRSQGTRYKFNQRWPDVNHRRFLFGHQVRDNVFWSAVSGCGIWTAYEVISLWAFANQLVPFLEWSESPVYFVLFFCAIPIIRDIHFYFVHRLLHYRFMYKSVHYLHHKNVNIGPWSGLSMHPVEHLLYFSGVLLHWILLSHPLHAIFHLQQTGLAPALGHCGFDKLLTRRGAKIHLGTRYYHYLHHRYFECNYGGDGTVPMDKWFGTFHDGSTEAHALMRSRRKRAHGAQP